MQGWFNLRKSINIIQYKNTLEKEKLHDINRYRKAFYKMQYLFVMKMLRKLGMERKFLNLIKTTHKKLTAKATLTGEKQSFPTMNRYKAKMSAFTIPFQHLTESP